MKVVNIHLFQHSKLFLTFSSQHTELHFTLELAMLLIIVINATVMWKYVKISCCENILGNPRMSYNSWNSWNKTIFSVVIKYGKFCRLSFCMILVILAKFWGNKLLMIFCEHWYQTKSEKPFIWKAIRFSDISKEA